MIHRVLCLLILAVLAATVSVAAPLTGYPANPGFEAKLEGWTVLAPEGAVAVEPAPGATGELALRLSEGWVISEPPTDELSGWLALTMRVRPPAERDVSSRLLIGWGTTADDAPEPLAALTAKACRGGWKRVRVELLVPPGGRPRVAVGVEGTQSWLVDDLAIETIAVESAPPGDAAVPESLAPGWKPDGLLDAHERTLGDARELLVLVGGLEVAIPDAVTAPRGHRGSLPVTVVNRGMSEKQLTISVSGPPGFFVPDRTVPIRPGGTTIFRASLQSLRLGEAWVRVTFTCEEESASAPVRVTTTPSYPAGGVAWLDGAPSDDELTALSSLGCQLHAVRLPADEAAEADLSLPDGFSRLILLGEPWSAENLTRASEALAGLADMITVYYPRAATHSAQILKFIDELQAFDSGFVLGPPLDLRVESSPTLSDDDLELAARLGEAGAIAAPMLRLPVLHPAGVRALTIDGRAPLIALPCWTRLQASTDIGPAAAAIRARARLPMFVAELAAAPSGSSAVDALVMARVLTAAAWQGLTGYTVPARPIDCPPGAAALSVLDADGAPRPVVAQVFAELARELAAAIPLRVYAQDDRIGLADDALVGFRPFMRGDEGLLALWNNTGAEVNLIFETRTQPLDVHTVTIGPGGVSRSYLGAFHYSEEAVALNRPVVFVRLEPGEFKLLSMQLARAHAGWLSRVEFAPEIPRERSGPPNFFDEWEKRQIVR